MRTELIKLHKRLQATFVYVTHDQTEAMTMGDRIVVMKDGLIQQVDTPQKLYDEPRNVFVAGFIGSPQMNFIKGELDVDGGEFYVLINGDRFRIDSGKTNSKTAEYAGNPVIIGIRPENIHADDAFMARNPGNTISAVVDVSEPMGSEVYLYLDYGGSRLTARVPPGATYSPGANVTLSIDTTKLHLFDPETEEAI
jgi:multiple sugar transport system ATP-binding protein